MAGEYTKIPNVFRREEHGKNRLIWQDWSTPEIGFLSECQWTWTEKIDGTNVRVIWDGYRVEFRGRTDRAQLPRELNDVLEGLFGGPDKEELFEQTFGEKEVVLFGEGYGGHIQGAGPKYGACQFILFDVRIGEIWLERKNVESIAEVFGLDVVPIVGHGNLKSAIEYVLSHPHSIRGNIEMEGVVCRPDIELRSRAGDRIIVKIKWRDFKDGLIGLAYKEDEA